MADDRRKSSPDHRAVDAELILAIRDEMQHAVLPITERLDRIDDRLNRGDTVLTLLDHRVNALEPKRKPEICGDTTREVKALGERISVGAVLKILAAVATLVGAFTVGKLT